MERIRFSQVMILSNAYQGDYERVLAVCTVGALRSPTLVKRIHERGIEWNCRSCGLDENSLIPISKALLFWADKIICMDSKQCYSVRERIENIYYGSKPKPEIFNFMVEDNFKYNDDQLNKIFDIRIENLYDYQFLE